MDEAAFKAVLDAPTEELAVAAASRGTQLNEAEEESFDDKATAFIANLSERERTLVRHFQNAEWLKVILKVVDGDDNKKLKQAVNEVAAEIASAVLEATETQYDEKQTEASLPETVKVRSIDRLQAMAKWTPLRLTWAEREIYKLLESTLYISDYTDNIDIYHSGHKNKQIVKQIRQICSILSGLVIARDYEEGQRLLKDRDFRRLAPFFQTCFEIGRRYKQLNPERMRDSYGKLMYFLMDSRADTIMNMLGFDCVYPIKTVEEFLKRKNGGLELLRDPLLVKATAEIYAEGLTRYQVQALQNEKEEATKILIHKYAEQRTSPKLGGRGILNFSLRLWSAPEEEAVGRLEDPGASKWNSEVMTQEDVELAVYSLKDHMTFLRYNERPVDKMLLYLEHFFDPEVCALHTSLAISAGAEGSRLSHKHSRQFHYVRQSLLLWREVLRNFLMLWSLADQDLLDSRRPYKLQQTGQGLNRIQACPRVAEAFDNILAKVQKEAGGWIGSAVVHLGDKNVPNALMFIDKYTQIPRIINPIIQVIEDISRVAGEYPGIQDLIDKHYGGCDALRLHILRDFFRHAFDGSGADNFFDAGSCIDGRLTSAWNWCSIIEKKPYYPIFLLSGFVGFDGKF
eukprot:Gregarina_sp_Poly_1__1533@NODE_1387_length_4237_cov_146_288729_g928_i0_p1_GENE_NODE_1387_length_4237_cov_146_288729_g928_i0NODE_1387_length_4237_cov_146_288729_g928_i0_p1_ORF_typecomplete_len643_score98_41DUF2009/PF09418_10/3_9e03DUF2009/PF09418_10/1_7e66DUF2009/PF09418_10/9e127RNA_pol_Rpc82/PF05645_13/0_039RNA_pol_Rpb6/PF01192_22/0_74RNA_pol_Rpb6/PF01192_22/4_5e03_NODE_1387_length_4237_cov_146_288729_g928_i0501930